MTKKIDYIVMCSSISVEPVTNNPTFSGVFNNINSAIFPSIYPKLYIITGFSAGTDNEKGRCNGHITIVDALGNTIAESSAEIIISEDNKAIWVNEFVSLPIPQEGEYAVNVTMDEITEKFSFNVRKI